jgi:hypothetical protein
LISKDALYGVLFVNVKKCVSARGNVYTGSDNLSVEFNDLNPIEYNYLNEVES